MSKPTDHWCTPKALADLLPTFHLDPCSNPQSTVRALVRVMEPDDGLKLAWCGTVWCNPPYSNVRPWVDKAIEHADAATTFFLVKADPTTKWWHRAVADGGAYYSLFRRRVRFEGASSAANFPSALLQIGSKPEPQSPTIINVLRREGWIW